MSGKITIEWTNWRGKKVTRDVNMVIDVRDFLGTPGYSELVIAANTHLSVSDIERFFQLQARETDCVERSRSFIYRRRWVFQKPGADNRKGREADEDGNYARAVAVMREHSKLSSRQLVILLKENGIVRSREWVRKHRCDSY